MDLDFLKSILLDLSNLKTDHCGMDSWILLVMKLTSKLNHGCTPGFALSVTRIITCWRLTRDDRIGKALVIAVEKTIKENKNHEKYVGCAMFMAINMVWNNPSRKEIYIEISKTAAFSARFVIERLQRIKHRKRKWKKFTGLTDVAIIFQQII